MTCEMYLYIWIWNQLNFS